VVEQRIGVCVMNTVCCKAKLLRVIKFWKNEARVMIDAIERVIACDLRDSIKSMVYKRKITRITRNHTKITRPDGVCVM